MSRKYGIDLRFRRLGWRRFRPGWRELDLCALYERYYGFDLCFGGAVRDPEEIVEPSEGPSVFPGGPDIEAVRGGPLVGGPGCPFVLRLMGWLPVEPFDAVNLANVGCRFPSVGGQPTVCVNTSGAGIAITALRRPRSDVFQRKDCTFIGSMADAQTAARDLMVANVL